MAEILTRAGCFAAIIVLGMTLRKLGVFRESDFRVLSTIVIKITLPATIISSFAGQTIDPSMLTLTAIGLGGGVAYLLLGYLLNLRSGKDRRAFEMLNLPGYNIGNFTLPFVQSFLGPVGVITTSLFDTGNAVVCLGGSYGVASSVKAGGKFDLRRVGKALGTSVPFLCYILVVSLNLLHIPLPGPVIECAGIIANANAFMAMLMIGVGFRITANREQIGSMVRILSVRYAVSIVLALFCYFVLPFDLRIRQTMVILVFAPIGSAIPAFTAELGGDVGLSSAINSISIVISIIVIVTLLTIML
ncbi:MAG: AEC family transporter [Oscillospiraceae bacterium]|nr:AEC family transporter [Oscillospiraceae bacterium]